MHAGGDHRPVGPVQGVDEPVVPVDGPAAVDRGAVEADGVGEQPAGCVVAEHRTGVQRQAGPLQLVADGDPVGPEGVRGPVGVVLGQHPPGGVEVLRQPPVALPRPAVHDALDHPDDAGAQLPGGPLPQRLQRVGGGQHRLDAVHVGVDAAVVRAGRPAGVPLLHGHPGRVVPEVPVPDGERLVQQRPAAGHPRGRGARAREHHEGVHVGGLGVVGVVP